MMNSKLLKLEKVWYEQIIELYGKVNENQKLSIPYFMGVSEKYEKSNNRIMIVGQEPYDFPIHTKKMKIDIEKNQKWSIDYINSQVYDATNYKKNNSPFWNAFRKIRNRGFDICWNNIINFHQIIDGKTYAVNFDIRKNTQIKIINNKTLFQLQLEITKPKAIWFVTGPAYAEDMANALQINYKDLKQHSPCPKNNIQNISHLIKDNNGIKYYWSYHPKYLQINKMLDTVIEKIQ